MTDKDRNGVQTTFGQTDPLADKPVVLLFIKEHHANAILDGDKRYEYRRTPPAFEPPYRVVLYATGDVKAVVGGFETHTVLEAPVDELIEKTVRHTPHDAEDLEGYFEGKETGAAIRVDLWQRYDDAVPLETLQGAGVEFHVPQNFQYLHPAEHAPILEELPYERGVPYER